MNAEQAKLVHAGLTGCHDDYATTAGTCHQAADELDAVSQAIANGATYAVTGVALEGIAQRLRCAAELGAAIDKVLGKSAEVQP